MAGSNGEIVVAATQGNRDMKTTGLDEAPKYIAHLLALGLSLLVFLALPAYADGTYCIRQGYIAYNLRPLKATHPAQQVLHVVAFDHGIRQMGEVVIQDFAVHEFRCEADRIEIAGYDRDWLKYVVGISQPGKVRIIERTEQTLEQHPFVPGHDSPPSLQGEGYDPEEVRTLASGDLEDEYQLVFMHADKLNKRELGIEHTYRAEIRQVDSRGKVLQRLLLYQETMTEFAE